jgi:hypothetical protein
LNICHDPIKLDVDFQKLTVEIKIAPNVFQNVMSKLTHNVEYVIAFLDDLLMASYKCFNEHPLKMEIILEKLFTSGMIVNAPESKLFAENINHL